MKLILFGISLLVFTLVCDPVFAGPRRTHHAPGASAGADCKSWTPALANTSQPSYHKQTGYYCTSGSLVHLWIDVEWSNAQPTQQYISAAVELPFQPMIGGLMAPSAYTGSVNVGLSQFGSFTAAAHYYLSLDAATGGPTAEPSLLIRAVSKAGGPNTQVNLGLNERRRLVGHIVYISTDLL